MIGLVQTFSHELVYRFFFCLQESHCVFPRKPWTTITGTVSCPILAQVPKKKKSNPSSPNVHGQLQPLLCKMRTENTPRAIKNATLFLVLINQVPIIQNLCKMVEVIIIVLGKIHVNLRQNFLFATKQLVFLPWLSELQVLISSTGQYWC